MAEVTAARVAGDVGESAIPGLATAIARALPPMRALGPRHTLLAVNLESQPTRRDMLAGDEAVGSLVATDYPHAAAVCPHAVWRLTSQRRGVLSRMAIAEDAVTHDAAAAFYPGLRPGGVIALHDTDFRLTLPWTKSGWRLLDEDGQPVATIERGDPDECRTGGCRLVGQRLRLEQPGDKRHPDLALVLLTAVWVITTASLELPVMGSC